MRTHDMRTIYTIKPEFGGAYGWIKQNGHLAGSSQLGPNHADTTAWCGDHPISDELQREFARWQTRFEIDVPVNTDVCYTFDWAAFHQEGFKLAKRLKSELGEVARVFYRKPSEDPSTIGTQEWEVMSDGNVVELNYRLEAADMIL